MLDRGHYGGTTVNRRLSFPLPDSNLKGLVLRGTEVGCGAGRILETVSQQGLGLRSCDELHCVIRWASVSFHTGSVVVSPSLRAGNSRRA